MDTRFFQELDSEIDQHRHTLAFGDALARLWSNRDFKKVIQEGYLEKEAIRLVHLKAAPESQTPERQQAILSQLDSIGHFNQYLQQVQKTSEIARLSLEQAENTREQLLQEDQP